MSSGYSCLTSSSAMLIQRGTSGASNRIFWAFRLNPLPIMTEALDTGRMLKASRTLLMWLWSGIACLVSNVQDSLNSQNSRHKHYGRVA